MPRVDGSLGSLIQGLSQQPKRNRRPGQVEVCVNALNDPVRGVVRRPPSQFIADLTGMPEDISNTEFGFVEDGYGATVLWAADGGNIRLYSLTDGALLETMTNAYLNTVDGESNLRLKTINGVIMVLNNSVEVAMTSGAPADAFTDHAWVCFARGGQPDTEYRITLTDPDGTWTMVRKTSATVSFDSTPGALIASFADLFDGTTAPTAGSTFEGADENGVPELDPLVIRAHMNANLTMEEIENHLAFTYTGTYAESDVAMSTTDGGGTNLIFVMKDEIDEAGHLPLRAQKNRVVLVAGEAVDRSDDYYVKWITDSASADGSFEDIDGVWRETTNPTEDFQIDANTMPHEILKDGLGAYFIRTGTWADRAAGDDLSNPRPEFIGDKLQDMIEFQSRLLFVHSRWVNLSQSFELGNFWLQSATGLQDDDRMSARAPSGDGDPTMTRIVPYASDLLIFAEPDTQYVLDGDIRLTPHNISVALTTEFGFTNAVRPQFGGGNVFFSSVSGNNTQLHEMFWQGNQETHDRRTVTEHVPKLLPTTIDNMVVSDSGSYCILWASTAPSTLYLYQYLWLDQKKVQSAWSIWTFYDDVISINSEDAVLNILFNDKDVDGYGPYLAKIDLTETTVTGLEHIVHLDRQQVVTSPTVTMPKLDGTETYFGVYGGSTDLPGLTGLLTETPNEGNLYDYTISPLGGPDEWIVGLTYETRYVPTMPVVRDAQGIARAVSDLTVSKFLVRVEDTGPVTFARQSDYEAEEDWWIYEWSGMDPDDPLFELDTASVTSAEIDFTFEENAGLADMAIYTRSHLPMQITEIEWRGFLRGVSTRVSTGAS